MTDQQFERLRRNRQSNAPASLASLTVRERRQGERGSRAVCTPLASVLARAARSLHRRQVAERAWRRIADADWQAETEVESVAKGVLTIAASGPAVLYVLRRRAAELERRLAQAIPGVSRVTFVVSESPDRR